MARIPFLIFLCGKKAGSAIVVYYIGYTMHIYLQYSILWIVLAVLLVNAEDLHLTSKLIRKDLHRNLTSTGEKDVCLSNMERAEWMNKIIRQLWPNINNYVSGLVKGMLNKTLENKCIYLEKLCVGNNPIRIGGILVKEHTSKDEIVLDIDISYAGDCHIAIAYTVFRGSIKNFQLYGKMRVIIKPLIDVPPLAGGIQVFFLKTPDIDFDLDGLWQILKLNPIKDYVKNSFLDTISSMLVLPNKYSMIFRKNISKKDNKIPQTKVRLMLHSDDCCFEIRPPWPYYYITDLILNMLELPDMENLEHETSSI